MFLNVSIGMRQNILYPVHICKQLYTIVYCGYIDISYQMPTENTTNKCLIHLTNNYWINLRSWNSFVLDLVSYYFLIQSSVTCVNYSITSFLRQSFARVIENSSRCLKQTFARVIENSSRCLKQTLTCQIIWELRSHLTSSSITV